MKQIYTRINAIYLLLQRVVRTAVGLIHFIVYL
jgi:hypothetical protein